MMQFSEKRDTKQGFASSSSDHILHNDDFACYFRKILCLHIFTCSLFVREGGNGEEEARFSTLHANNFMHYGNHAWGRKTERPG